jgi:outer membrane receptor for ferrienterochelin and colicins
MHKILSIIVFALLYSNGLSAQNYSIKGKTLNETASISGVVIKIKELSKATISGQSGEFKFDGIPKGNYTLGISYIGFISQEIKVTLKDEDLDIGTLKLKEDFLELEQVVITATRNEVLRKDAPIICNILGDKILKATQSITLSEGLSFQPALRIENNCQNCGFNGLRMNGLESAYSQVLIDGRPIFNSLQGVYGLEQIPSNMIERVEIVRSGGSALYGSSAVAGTVNVITKEPKKNSYYLTTNQSLINGEASDRTFMAGTDVVNENRTTGLTLNGFNRNRDHWDTNGDGFSEVGELNATSFSLKAYYKPTDLSKLTITSYNIYEYRRGGNLFELPFHETDITESTTHNILNGGVTYEQYTKNEKHKFSLYINAQNLNRDSYYGGGRDPKAYGNSEDNSLVSGIQYSGKLGEFAGGSHTLVSGMEYNHNNLKDNAPSYNRFIDQTANQIGYYLQDVWEIGSKFNVLLGGRIDNHSLVGEPILSPRANVLYKINPEIQFRVGYAKGFRAPQVFDEDLHITQVGGGGTVVTNANKLTPEYSNAYSSSIDFNKYSKDWALGVTIDGFYTQLTNVFILEELGTNSNGDILIERRNGEGATVAGITINPKLQYKDKLSFQLGLTIQKSMYNNPVQWSETVYNDSKNFFKTPNNYGFYVLSWTAAKNFIIDLSGVYTGSMEAQHYAGYITEDVLETTPSFFENNFKLEFSFNLKEYINITLNTGIQNFTNAFQNDFDMGKNRDSAYIYGPGRPRTYFFGFNLNF